jgi:hypothetical protein
VGTGTGGTEPLGTTQDHSEAIALELSARPSAAGAVDEVLDLARDLILIDSTNTGDAALNLC